MSPFAQNKAFNPYLPTDSNLFVTAPKPRFVDLISLFAVYFVNTSFLVSSVLVPSFGFLSGAVNYIILSVSNYS